LTNEEGTFFRQSSLIDDNGVITLGPHIEGASVEAKVLHLKGDKVIVFKRKKRYKREMVTDSILLKL
jgi:ribosomal protein L21